MTTASLPLVTRDRFDAARTLRAGITVGVLDGLSAIFFYLALLGVMPTRLFQGIARALLGKAAYDGGLATAALGLAMHFSVALAWTALYAILHHTVPALRRLTRTTAGAIVAGAAFGFLVQVMMSLVIVPLTQITPGRPFTGLWWAMAAIHMTAVGQPMAWIIRDRA